MKLNSVLPGDLGLGPHFMADATYGAVKGVGADELEAAGARILMTNAFHLMLKPGVTTIRALGGLKSMMGWRGVLATDSGGFQAYSLIRQNPKYGTITKDGLTFVSEQGKKIRLTPDKAVVNQLRLGADILFCLDDCTHAEDGAGQQSLSVEHTIMWAKTCKETFVRMIDERGQDKNARPRLFAVVQGGRDPGLRRSCANALLEIGFDGFGFGGWPLDSDGALLSDMLTLLREEIPTEFPLHALGVGHPYSVAECARIGYALFDSSLPTRDARRGRIYRFASPDITGPGWLALLRINDAEHMKVNRPIEEDCPCVACERYSVGYLHHLARREEPLFWRLATLHNLTFMKRLTDALAAELRS